MSRLAEIDLRFLKRRIVDLEQEVARLKKESRSAAIRIGDVLLHELNAKDVELEALKREYRKQAEARDRKIRALEREIHWLKKQLRKATRKAGRAIYERNVAVRKSEEALAQRKVAVSERDNALAQRDAAVSERDSAHGERLLERTRKRRWMFTAVVLTAGATHEHWLPALLSLLR